MLEDVDTIISNAQDDDIFDIIEIHHNCTVEVLKNTRTGEISVGWYYDLPYTVGGNDYDNQRRICQ